MTNDTNPAVVLRAAMRDLLAMFRETLGDQAGAAALKTAVERALSEVTGVASKGSGKASKSSRRSAAKPAAKRATKSKAKAATKSKATSAAPKGTPASKGGTKKKKKAKAGPPSPGRLRQMQAMKEYWRKRRIEAEAGKKSGADSKA